MKNPPAKENVPELLFSEPNHPEINKCLLFNVPDDSRRKEWKTEIEVGSWDDEVSELISDGLPILLGIDPSLNCTGLCISNGKRYLTGTIVPGRLTTKAGGMLKNHNVIMGPRKMSFIYQSLRLVLDAIGPLVSHVAIEGLSFGSKGRSLVDLARWRGRIEAALIETCPKAKLVVISPNKLKVLATGSYRAKKPEMNDAVEKLYQQFYRKVQHKTDDEIDALFLVKTMEDMIKGRKFKKLEWEIVS